MNVEGGLLSCGGLAAERWVQVQSLETCNRYKALERVNNTSTKHLGRVEVQVQGAWACRSYELHLGRVNGQVQEIIKRPTQQTTGCRGIGEPGVRVQTYCFV